MRIECPQCKKQGTVADKLRGLQSTCPKCGTSFTLEPIVEEATSADVPLADVPGPEGPEEAEPPVPPSSLAREMFDIPDSRYVDWHRACYSVYMDGSRLVADNPLIYRMYSFFLYMRKTIIDPEERCVLIVTRWLLFFRRVKKIPFADIDDLVPSYTTDRTYEVRIVSRKLNNDFLLASFLTGVSRPGIDVLNPAGMLAMQGLPPVHEAYYGYFDTASQMMAPELARRF